MTQSASSLINKVVYTASLATNYNDIKDMTDTLRMVTARISDTSQPLSPRDSEELMRLQYQLEDYLVNRETLRKFTPESLALQIEQHMAGGTGRKSLLQVWLVIAVSVVVAAGVAFLPFLNTAEQRGMAAGATAFSLITIGAGWLFVTALTAFRSNLRRAFLTISGAVCLLGLSLLEMPILVVFELRDYAAANIIFPLPILVASVLFHVGDVLYARLVGVKNFWTSVWPPVIAGAGLSAITWFLPHATPMHGELVHYATAVICAWILVMPVVSVAVLLMAARRVPDLYKPSVYSLFIAMFPIIAVTGFQYGLAAFKEPSAGGGAGYLLFTLVIVMGVTLLRAGYMFNKVSRY